MKHINAKSVRDLALHIVKQQRPAWKAERVSKSFLERIDYRVRLLVQSEVMTQPSRGKTIS